MIKHRVTITELNGDWNAEAAEAKAHEINAEMRDEGTSPVGGIFARVEALPSGNLHRVTETLTTPELSLGDIVLFHGLICLIDKPIRMTAHGAHATHALVLNRDEVSTDEIPFSFTAAHEPGGRMCSDAEKREHRWTIQGNELARWSVIRATK